MLHGRRPGASKPVQKKITPPHLAYFTSGHAEQKSNHQGRFFLFLYFLFSFFTKIYVRVRNLHEYTPAAPLSGGRAFLQKISRKICARVPEGPAARQRGGRPPGRPPAGRRAPAGRPAAGRPPPPPLYKGLADTPPLICLTKNPEKKKRGRRERGEALPDFRAGDCR